MKPFLITAFLSFSIVFGLLFLSHKEFAVKYEQIFAEKHIVLTEHMTLADKLRLRNKKGFVKYVD